MWRTVLSTLQHLLCTEPLPQFPTLPGSLYIVAKYTLFPAPAIEQSAEYTVMLAQLSFTPLTVRRLNKQANSGASGKAVDCRSLGG